PDTSTLSLHDALPICPFRADEIRLHGGNLFAEGFQRRVKLRQVPHHQHQITASQCARLDRANANKDDSGGSSFGILVTAITAAGDRKSTRLNSSHDQK